MRIPFTTESLTPVPDNKLEATSSDYLAQFFPSSDSLNKDIYIGKYAMFSSRQ